MRAVSPIRVTAYSHRRSECQSTSRFPLLGGLDGQRQLEPLRVAAYRKGPRAAARQFCSSTPRRRYRGAIHWVDSIAHLMRLSSEVRHSLQDTLCALDSCILHLLPGLSRSGQHQSCCRCRCKTEPFLGTEVQRCVTEARLLE